MRTQPLLSSSLLSSRNPLSLAPLSASLTPVAFLLVFPLGFPLSKSLCRSQVENAIILVGHCHPYWSSSTRSAHWAKSACKCALGTVVLSRPVSNTGHQVLWFRSWLPARKIYLSPEGGGAVLPWAGQTRWGSASGSDGLQLHDNLKSFQWGLMCVISCLKQSMHFFSH